MFAQISIITPSLNQAAFLHDALLSVSVQRGADVEHIIVDSGSWDASREIAKAHVARTPGARLELAPARGPAAAINLGAARAEGAILGWLCADDCYASDSVLKQVLDVFAADPDCDAVYGRGFFVDARGRLLEETSFEPRTDALLEALAARDAFAQPACFFRRSLLGRVGALDESYRHAFDHEFWLRLAAAGRIFRSLDADLARKRRHADAVSSLLPGVRAMNCAKAVRRHAGREGLPWIAQAVRAETSNDELRSDRFSGRRNRALDAVVRVVARRLRRQHDVFVVLGNGPSLTGFDFAELAGADCIGMNAAYRFWREVGWHPRYYACLDLVVGLSHKAEIAHMIRDADALGMEAFLLRANLIEALPTDLQYSPCVIDFDALAGRGSLLDSTPLTTGSHAALFGALLGYRQMLLLGVDCNYVEMVEGARRGSGVSLELVSKPQSNPNYFFDDYQAPGDRYNLPNPAPDMHLDAWRTAGARLADRGVEVRNCSPNSRVDVFARGSWQELGAPLVRRYD